MSINPHCAFEGIGLMPSATGAVSGELIGTVNLNSKDYIIFKNTLTFGNENLGEIGVREALVDLYHDGSGILWLNQEQSSECRQLEHLLSMESSKKILDNDIPVHEICMGSCTSKAFECVLDQQDVAATAIRPEVFNHKKQLISRCHQSFANLQEKLEEMYEKEAQADNIAKRV